MITPAQLDYVFNLVCRWRNVFAGWQLGTRKSDDGECRAVKDHRELTILLRIEQNAFTKILLDKGIVTEDELRERFHDEALYYNDALKKQFPGFEPTASGITMTLPDAAETVKRLNFPP